MPTPNDPPIVATKVGGPRHSTIHPNGKWGYLITERPRRSAPSRSKRTLVPLLKVAGVDTGDCNQKDSAQASDIHVTPNGRFPSSAVRTSSMLHGYKIDPENSTLTGIGTWPTVHAIGVRYSNASPPDLLPLPGRRSAARYLCSWVGGAIADHRPFITLEQDALSSAFEIVILAASQRPHERGEARQPQPDCDRNEKEEIDHVAPRGMGEAA